MNPDQWTEQDFASCVVEYYSQMPGWTLHHEVQAGAVADLVATNGKIIHVIEVKKTRSLALLDQLHGWRGCAHFISAATPAPKINSRSSYFFLWALKQMGCGLFELNPKVRGDDYFGESCREAQSPRLTRKIQPRLQSALCDEQTRPDEWAHAGASRGGRYTPFRRTCKAVEAYVRSNPGCTMKEIVDSVEHHYTSDSGARSSLAQWVRQGKVQGVEKGDKGYVLAEVEATL